MRPSFNAIEVLIAARTARRYPRLADHWVNPIVERMESRLLLTGDISGGAQGIAEPIEILNSGMSTPDAYSTPASAPITPALMRNAYGLGTYNSSNVVFNGIQGTGAGQTIALVEGTSDPDIVADMTAFDTYWGLPAPPSLTQYNATGGTGLPGVFDSDVLEMDLDVEWAHVMAPQANLVLFEGLNLYAGITTAASWPGVSVISISYTISGTEPVTEFETPNGHNGVTFVASSGDTAKEVSDPSMSPAVVSVGGTHLVMSGSNYGSESGWSSGGGGVNTAEAQPSYQSGIVSAYSTTNRVTPDVALDADSATGVAVYDQYDNGTTTPWTAVVGGTSLSAPLMAGMVAVADQGRSLAGLSTLDGYTQTLPRLYSLYTDAYSTNYHDITTGGNGYTPGVGYDMSTGLGSPKGNALIPDLAGADTITGQVFVDANGNGVYDGSDTPIAGATVYLDINNTGVQTSNDPTAVTNSSGVYTFSDQLGSMSGVVRLASSSLPAGDLHSTTAASFTTSYDQTQTVNLGFYASTYAAAATTGSGGANTVALSVTGTGPADASTFLYTWTTTSEPTGATVSFSANGTNAAANSTATCSAAGTYTFTLTISDGQGSSVTSNVTFTTGTSSQVLTTIVVTPGSASLNENQTQTFSAVAYDQFGIAMVSQPTFTWAKTSGVGSINSSGVYTAPSSAGSATITASSGGVVGSSTITITNANPTITTPAAATPSTVTGTTTALSVLGNDDGGAANLLYTWAATTIPNGATTPAFSINGTNAARNTTATFTSAGVYVFTVTLSDGQGGTATSSVTVTVGQTSTTVIVTPGTASLNEDQTRTFTAVAYDQFGNALTSQPTFTWAKSSGIGSINSSGVYTAPAASGTATITATASAAVGSAAITISNASPTITIPASATPSPVTGTTTALSVLGNDDGGAANLLYTWAATTIPNGATTPTFSINGTNAAQNTTATFFSAGAYVFTVTLSDGQGGTVTSSVSVTVNQTLTSVVVTPGTASLNENQTRAFSAVAYDQFGNALTSQPSFSWAKTSGIGSINSSGVYTSPGTSGTAAITATASAIAGAASITVTDAAPTVTTPAAATPSPVTGTTTALSVTGNDDGGAANLTYTWAATTIPSGATSPTFSINGTNAAQNTTATFTRAGAYTFTVTLNDGQGGTVTSSVNVTVNQTLTSIVVSPGTTSLNENQTQAFTAVAYDQFGIAMVSQPTFGWSKTSGIGSINSSGLYSSPGAAGNATITATASSIVGSATITVTNASPTVTTPAAATPSPVTGTTTALSVAGNDDGGAANLTYTWAATTIPSGATAPTFSVNGTNAAQNTTATFSRAGAYTFTVTLNDGQGGTVSSSVSVTVNQTLTTVLVTPGTTSLHENQTQAFTAVAYDQFGIAMVSQPTFGWSKTSGIGSINSSGLYTAPGSAGAATITATASSTSGTASITVTNANPTIATPAAASPSTVTGTTTSLSVLGNDDGGAGNLLYTWAATTIPSGATAPTFSVNGTNAAQNATATFSKAGAYTFTVTVNDGQGGTVTSSVNVTVNQTLTSITVSPGTVTMNENQTQAFTAVAYDQFGTALATQPAFTWSRTSGGGSIGSTTGVYTSPGSTGTATIAASASSIVGSASITVNNSGPTVTTPAAATPSTITGTTTALSVLGNSDAGEANLSYTWVATSIPNGAAPPTFSINGTNAAKNTTATFYSAGAYGFTVTLNDGQGATATSSVNVTVNQTLNAITTSPGTIKVIQHSSSQLLATGLDQFGNAMAQQPAFAWSIIGAGVGSVSSGGLYTAPDTAGGTAELKVNVGALTATTSVAVVPNVIDGTDGNDTIRLVRSSSNLLIYLNDPTTPAYNISYVSLGALTIAEGNGTDNINVDFSGGGSPVPAGGLTITGGSGADVLTITGTSGNDTAMVNASTVSFDASPISYSNIGSVVINGNGGADTLTQNVQPSNGASLVFNGTTSGGPSSSDILNVNAGTFSFGSPATGSGIQPVFLASLSIASGASVLVGTAVDHSDRWVLSLGSLAINGGQLDLGGNDMILHSGNLSQLSTLLQSGSANGTWNGLGIASSTAANDPTHLTALGLIANRAGSSLALYSTFDHQSVSTSDLLLKFTYLGDTNLDGTVDSSDYSNIDSGFLSNLSGWSNGDFNYNGKVDGSDYILMDNAFKTQGISLAALPASQVASAEMPSAKSKKVALTTAASQPSLFATTAAINPPTGDTSCALFWKWYNHKPVFQAA